jgi:hypothetical protein
MTGHPVVKSAAPWVGLGAALALAVLLLGSGRGKAQPIEKPGEGVTKAQAQALVTELEAQLRATESSLKKAREILARFEADEKAKPKENAGEGEDQTDQVEGVWRIVGINGNNGGEFQKPPYDEYKIMSAGHYLWLSFNPDTGKVLRSGGGVYAIKDGKYTAHIECSNSDDLRALIGQEYKGTFRLEGTKWYHFGNVPNGAVFDELWERVH